MEKKAVKIKKRLKKQSKKEPFEMFKGEGFNARKKSIF